MLHWLDSRFARLRQAAAVVAASRRGAAGACDGSGLLQLLQVRSSACLSVFDAFMFTIIIVILSIICAIGGAWVDNTWTWGWKAAVRLGSRLHGVLLG